MHANTVHGHTRRHHARHPLYNIWSSIKQRCLNPTANSYRIYGGRGIRICPRWLASFQAFVDDMGPRPSAKHSIDRFPNRDGDYEPSNCRWATIAEQAANRHPAFTHRSENEKAIGRASQLASLQRSHEAHRNPPKTCRQCGAPYRRQGYSNPKKAPKFCSRNCYYANRNAQPRDSGRFT